jgi:hypothetical protein
VLFYAAAMTLSRKFNHDAVLVGVLLLALVLMTVANCMQFIRTGSVSAANAAWTVGIAAAGIWYARKL